jgi:predicted regulator of Ras-like GTPase activity (Roadblock/LC7/MglB family)
MTIPASHSRQSSTADVQNFNWLLERFAGSTPGVREVIAVSSDGLLVAKSATLDRARADQLAAITCAVVSLANGASRCYDLGAMNKIVIDLDRGYLLVSSIGVGSALGVLAAKSANLGGIGYEMALFANRAGAVLTPMLVEELKRALGG